MISKGPEKTEKMAKMIMSELDFGKIKQPVVFMLMGKLGGGKTVFAKGVGKWLGIKETITSPTFIIFNEYSVKFQVANCDFQTIERFVHFDLYRVESGRELDEISFFDLFTDKSVTCIEWPENMGKKYLKKLKRIVYTIDVWFEYGKKQNERVIKFS